VSFGGMLLTASIVTKAFQGALRDAHRLHGLLVQSAPE
jgi:hypothetical protein